MGLVSDRPLGGLAFRAIPVDHTVVEAAKQRAYDDGRVLEHDGTALFTWGVAAKLRLEGGSADRDAARQVTEVLAAFARVSNPSDPPDHSAGTVPLALGALPFDRDAPGELVVPSVAILAGGAHRPIACAIGQPADLLALSPFPFGPPPSEATAAPRAPDRFALDSLRSHDDFRARVQAAVVAIRSGSLEKVVLAREVLVTANRPFSQQLLLERARALHPSCATFAMDGFVGASPELLCRRFGSELSSRALAGTIPRSGDPEEDTRLGELLAHSEKDLAEHAFVVDAIAEVFRHYGNKDASIDGPHLLALRNVAHLATSVATTLDDDGPGAPSALELAATLHPTPAVGGVPRREALTYIAAHEEIDRDRYAGPVGFVSANGDGEWWVGIRSATLAGDTARLVAGVGVVATSDPDLELIETQLKFQALLAVAVRP